MILVSLFAGQTGAQMKRFGHVDTVGGRGRGNELGD